MKAILKQPKILSKTLYVEHGPEWPVELLEMIGKAFRIVIFRLDGVLISDGRNDWKVHSDYVYVHDDLETVTLKQPKFEEASCIRVDYSYMWNGAMLNMVGETFTVTQIDNDF